MNFTIRKATPADTPTVAEVWAEAAALLAPNWAKETGVLMRMDEETALRHIRRGVYVLEAGGIVQAWAKFVPEPLPAIPDRPPGGDSAERYVLAAARARLVYADHFDWERVFFRTWLRDAERRGVAWVWGSTPEPVPASIRNFVVEWGARRTVHPDTGDPLWYQPVAAHGTLATVRVR